MCVSLPGRVYGMHGNWIEFDLGPDDLSIEDVLDHLVMEQVMLTQPPQPRAGAQSF